MKQLLILITPLMIVLAACTKNETTATPATEDTATEKPKVKAPADEMGTEVYYFTDSIYLRSEPGAPLVEDNKTITTTETAILNKTKDQIIIRGHVHHRQVGKNKWSNTGKIGTSNDYFYSEVSKDGKTVRYYFTATAGGTKTETRLKGEIKE